MMTLDSKPRLVNYKVAKADFSEKGEIFIIEILHNKSYIKINASTKRFIDEIDGIKTYEEIANIMNEKFDFNLTENNVRDVIIKRLGKIGMVEGVSCKKNKMLDSRLWWHWNLINGTGLKKIAEKFNFLFNPIIFSILVLVLLMLLFILLSDTELGFCIKRKNINFFKSINLFIIFLLVQLTSIFHEFGHIVASFRYGVKPRMVGIGLYLFMPVLFVDLSESWILARKERCVIDLGGVYFQAISLIIYAPMMYLNNSIFNIESYKIIVYITLTNIIFNLNPTLRMDGYWVLSDLTGVVNLHTRIRMSIKNLVKKVLKKEIDSNKNYDLTKNSKRMFVIWSVFYIFITILFLFIGINKVIKLIHDSKVNLLIVTLLFVGYIILKKLIFMLKNKFQN